MVIYGHAWVNKFQTDEVERIAQAEWYKTLKDFTAPVINAALQKCKTVHKTFPPTAGEFEDICKSERSRIVFYQSSIADQSEKKRSPEMQKLWEETRNKLNVNLKKEEFIHG